MLDLKLAKKVVNYFHLTIKLRGRQISGAVFAQAKSVTHFAGPLQCIVRLVAPTLLWATTPGLQEYRHRRRFVARLASKLGAARIPQPKPLFLSEATGLWIIFVSGYH